MSDLKTKSSSVALTFETWAKANGYDRKKRRYAKVEATPRAVPGSREPDRAVRIHRDVG